MGTVARLWSCPGAAQIGSTRSAAISIPNSQFDELKGKLVGVVVVILAVLFLAQVVIWDGQRDLLGFGVAISLVIAVLTFFLSQKHK